MKRQVPPLAVLGLAVTFGGGWLIHRAYGGRTPWLMKLATLL